MSMILDRTLSMLLHLVDQSGSRRGALKKRFAATGWQPVGIRMDMRKRLGDYPSTYMNKAALKFPLQASKKNNLYR
jgi:hypothetical protein